MKFSISPLIAWFRRPVDLGRRSPAGPAYWHGYNGFMSDKTATNPYPADSEIARLWDDGREAAFYDCAV